MSDQSLPDFIASCLSSVLSEEGVDNKRTQAIIDEVDNQLRANYGGDEPYIPKKNRRQRNAEIIRDWQNNMPKEEIEKKHDVSRTTLNRVISVHLSSTRPATGFGSSEWNL